MEIKDRVLVVEDDKRISNFIKTVLEANNYDVIVAQTGAEAYSMVTSQCPDVVILDLGLPDMDGMKILQGVREWSAMPVIVVSARTHERDKVEALDLGADDYITKPFSVKLVLMRVEAVLRRVKEREGQEATTTLSYGNIRLDRESHSVSVSGKSISLTHTEYGLLELFMLHPGRVFTRDNLLNEVWGYDFVGEEKTVNIHIMNLRRKLDTDLIETIRGVGYRLGKEN